ncbi:hypothetical protein J056_003473 [Wallemia ichthyophaga EXF-994]|uniref:ABM domain-containing protein n=3 Tax=Wallemia ichthyophaga TaxID=245174 RepID=A0A4T0IYS9_WALIC|nr:uncharacterized protein J056_003473 [Wallemia ichthyophaga EXF-994]EOR02911.1 hypothetical protein J056_003473 [Wallemia ichthyophaga EXF-994]TIB34597.1 hypothetical protein E3P86_02801 [Wallemia ichthyophaga]
MVYTLIVHMRAKPETVEEVKGKLHEASRIYRNDKETIDWHVMQDPKDATKFAVVERYEQESSQHYHLTNPYWQTFDPYVVPRLAEEMQLSRFEEF